MTTFNQNANFNKSDGNLLNQIINYGANEGNPFKDLKRGTYARAFNINELVDRVDFLPAIDSKLQAESLPVYLHAIGGIGKTTIAQAYCNSPEYAERYDYIFWIESISNDVRKDVLGYDIFSFKSESDNLDNEFYRFVRQSRELDGNVLLIIDNVQQVEQIQSIEKDKSLSLLRWKILVTTRAILNDNKFKKRVVDVKELKINHCYDLFYSYYEEIEENKSENEGFLNKIFELLNYHTYLIVLLAKVGENGNYSIKKLLSMLDEKGLIHSELQIDIRSGNSKEYVQLYKHIESIFKFGQITDEERKILTCFSILPDRAILEDDLILWMKNDKYTELKLKETFKALFEKGWLIQERQTCNGEKFFTYKCHNLIQTVLRNKLKLDAENCQWLIDNFVEFMYVESGEKYTHKIPYYDCVDSILQYVNADVVPIYNLKKNYLKLLWRNDYSPKLAYSLAEYLKKNYEKVFPNKKSEDWIIGLLEINKLYSDSYVEYSQDKGKFIKTYELRKETLSIAQKHLSKDDIRFLLAERDVAISQRNLNQYKESISTLERICYDVDSLLNNERNEETRKKLQNLLLRTLDSLGISYNALARQKENDMIIDECIVSLRKGLEVRGKSLHLYLTIYNGDHTSLIAPYNNIGINFLSLYKNGDTGKDNLEHAQEYITKAQKIRLKEFGEHSNRSAVGYSNIANLFEVQGRYAEALEMAIKSLNVRKEIFDGENYLAFLFSYKRIASIYFSQWSKEKNNCLLDLAGTHINKAIEIADYIYAGDTENHEYKACLILRDKIRADIEK
jgi:hypothetical protein